MDISFIILTWNSREYINQCITSILNNVDSNRFTYEIIVVDNGSHDGTRSIIQYHYLRHHHIIRPIYLNRNRGTTYSRNLALKNIQGRYIVIVDSDIEIRKATIERLIDYLARDGTIGIIVPKLVYPSGLLQKSTDMFPTLLTKLFRFFFLKMQEKAEHCKNLENTPKTVDYAISAFWVMKREMIDIVGLLDEKIFYSPEDVDYCLRIWKKGYRILYLPEAVAIHHAQELSRGFRISRAMTHHMKGLFYFFIKHRYIFIKPKLNKSK